MRRSLFVVLTLLAACGDDKQPRRTPVDMGPVEVLCEALAPLPSTCELTPGNSTKLLKGTVLTPQTVYVGGQVAVDPTGRIACVGCKCAVGGETTVVCPEAVISPGLINTHDHITFTQNQPYRDAGVRYDDRHQWRLGLDDRPEIPAPGGASADAVRWGELRFLLGGATSIVGSGGQAGLLRNLDQPNNQEGLDRRGVRFDTFPLDDTDGTRRMHDCNYGGSPTTAASIATFDAYEPHTSEGISATARNEFLCETSSTYDPFGPGVSNDLLLGKTAMIHAIGLLPADYGVMAAAGTGLIWSPRSNITLYGDTARVTVAARLGVKIALGTDWMPTGSMNLQRELACADAFNASYLERFFTDDELWKMVTSNAAAVTKTDDVIGRLAEGMIADIAIFASRGRAPFRSVIEAQPQDVALVMRGGKTLYGDEPLVAALATSCDTIDVCGVAKGLCTMGEVGKTFSALQTGAGANIYPAFTCELPKSEPSCLPMRPASVAGSTIYTGVPSEDDDDGDGVPNATDLCPRTFDPVRPLDGGAQGDADGDGQGDACDVCPLDAGTETCTAFDLRDRDDDGLLDAADNCSGIPNAGQADEDSDGKGDVCDLCPKEANMGVAGCPSTIYQVHGRMVPSGFSVRITNALVTGVGSNGFFVQVKETDQGYTVPDHSGLFVFTGGAPRASGSAAPIKAGQRVTVDGSPALFQGEMQLGAVASLQITSLGPEDPPAPIPVSYSDIRTGGPRAAALEAVLVSLGPARVSAYDAMFKEITLTEDGTGSTLVVDDFLFEVPQPALNVAFVAVTGILQLRQMMSKLEPRNEGDILFGAPSIGTFGPALSFARVGAATAAPSFPQALTVTLTGPARGDTAITLEADDPDALEVTSPVIIPNGQTSAVVLVKALAPKPKVTITATLDTQSVTADVRTLGDAEGPTAVTLTPETATIRPGASRTLTATLDLPALGNTAVGLALNPPGAGTLPPEVTVPDGQVSATFSYVNATAVGTVAITATLGGSSDTSTLVVASLVISQVYGGGGNAGAPLRNDFIEIHNITDVDIPLAGLSVQYAASTGTSWANFTVLPATATVPAGGYFLIAQSGGMNGAALPTPDATGMIAMAAGAGKVALVATGVAMPSGACPTGIVIDFVGYGAASCSESNEDAPALSNTTAALRNQAGCTDSDNNEADFTAGPPAPRNKDSPPVVCP